MYIGCRISWKMRPGGMMFEWRSQLLIGYQGFVTLRLKQQIQFQEETCVKWNMRMCMYLTKWIWAIKFRYLAEGYTWVKLEDVLMYDYGSMRGLYRMVGVQTWLCIPRVLYISFGSSTFADNRDVIEGRHTLWLGQECISKPSIVLTNSELGYLDRGGFQGRSRI